MHNPVMPRLADTQTHTRCVHACVCIYVCVCDSNIFNSVFKTGGFLWTQKYSKNHCCMLLCLCKECFVTMS